ncbi:MAG: septal ring lytic transglycosylase RlpA family protein [Pseudolabrys sp.]|nr:septal ring lytic transglycosylase RlpA family protein [Pseudolabrys sp.]
MAEPRAPRVSDMAIAGMLALGLLLTLFRFGDDESYVVSIADLDTAIVVALPGPELVPQERLADQREDAVTPVVAALPQPATTHSPGMDFLRGLANGSSEGASWALATVVGIASTYNPFRQHPDAAVASTASGEAYDPEAWTAAIQIDRRHDFGGVRYGRLYRPTFALLERGDRRAVVRINDVGPLRPGRVIDLNERSMRYFDPTLQLGLVPDMKITLLPGEQWTPGPVDVDMKIDLASAM